MRPDYLRTLFAYHRWATERVLAAAESLTAEQFTRDLGSSFPSVRDTLVHMLSAEWIWLQRLEGASPTGFDDPASYASVDQVRDRWREVAGRLRANIESLDEARLASDLAYRNTRGQPFSYPLWKVLAHLANHATYHRGQVITMIRQLGGKGVSTDLVYFDEAVG
jgi:uncharacterized damage-inducible protein DinB